MWWRTHETSRAKPAILVLDRDYDGDFAGLPVGTVRQDSGFLFAHWKFKHMAGKTKQWRVSKILKGAAHCLKITQNVALAFSTSFCPIKTDLSGNTVWPQASGFQKLAKMDHFWHFYLTLVHSKCNCSSLRLQFWTRLFLWFWNTVSSGVVFEILSIRTKLRQFLLTCESHLSRRKRLI